MKIDDIQIQNLSFKYKGTDKFILKNININEINQLNYWKNWLWKITLIKIILNYSNPLGKVLVNNTNISENLRLWYKNLSYVPQKVYLSMSR